ncbi:hypothetical protein [Saccharophagus degradans]|uniref:Uncharacterized protein n=1 Tax=Saccharophagus degradans (strain 2-40 / ATCC 43961 / DSM 17024) TaxID=203122 RepID=Q21F10_SACD2|nr:hypothetical protein [Saccharophagus degradans]ABD82719.1 conserved hypothetical protein [Saccharophagus degradans 2-40]
MSKLLNLGDHSDSSSNSDLIEFRKLKSKISSISRMESKPSKCFYCAKDTTQFCNSHSVPASFLRNISVDGELYTNNELIELPFIDSEKGVNNSGTFRIICRNCDSAIFREYENKDNYINDPTDKMIAQIAMKNHLRNIDKRLFEVSLYDKMKDGIPGFNGASTGSFMEKYIIETNEINRLDLNEYIRSFKRAKRIIDKGYKDEYYLFYYEKLDYTVPMAFQGELSLHFDLDDNIINNVYNKSKKYKLQSLHVSVFPLESQSIIMLFIDKNDKRYRSFYKQFRKLSKTERLAAINFIIFSLSEDVYISKNIHESYINDESIKSLAGLTSIQFSDSDVVNSEVLKKSFSFSNMNSIPNYLTYDSCSFE